MTCLFDKDASHPDRNQILFPLLYLPESAGARFLYGAMECHSLEAGPFTPFVQNLTLNHAPHLSVSETHWHTVSLFTNVRRLIAVDLGAAWHELPSLTPLCALTTLNSLALVDSNLGFRKNPLAPLSHLENLYCLVLRKNKLGLQDKSLLPLSTLTRLEMLCLSDNALKGTHTFEALRKLAGLTHLNLNNNKIGKAPEELHPLLGLPRLKKLSLKRNRVGARENRSIEALCTLPALEELNLRDSRLGSKQADDLVPLARITSLTNLNLKNNSLGTNDADLLPLAQLARLRVLNLSGNKLATYPGSLFGIKDLLSIVTLHLDYNTLQNTPPLNMTPLAGLVGLRVLTLRKNALGRIPESLSPLMHLLHLRHLDLAYNDLGHTDNSLAPLSKLVSLHTLDISFNGFGYYPGELAPLTHLTNLQILRIKSRESGPHFIMTFTQVMPYLTRHLSELDATTHVVALHSWARRTRTQYPHIKITV